MTTILQYGGPHVCIDVYRKALNDAKSLKEHNTKLVELINNISFHISNNGPLSKEAFVELVERNAH